MLGQMTNEQLVRLYEVVKSCKTSYDFLYYADNDKKLSNQKSIVASKKAFWLEQEKAYKTERSILQNMCKHVNSELLSTCAYCDRDMKQDVGSFGYDG